ncbi:MAG TPA: hypothetical protein VG817_02315 [Gemmatimonadales bacterium]|nr:hypothetical protein [Gemmatimonadales bacterium]
MTAPGPVRFREVVIVGGGCYGTFYARQLSLAREKGRAEFDCLVIVDRDPGCQFIRDLGQTAWRELVVDEWNPFFDRYLTTAVPSEVPDVIVPSPLMPHLMFQWLERRAADRWPGREVRAAPVETGPGTPYDRLAPDGTRYVSFADWLCPTHCVEPAICPVTRAPRTWEMTDALARLAGQVGAAGPALFRCEHQVFGVGTFPVAEVLAGDRIVQQAGAAGTEVDVLVGTISSCHGAVSLLHLGGTKA